MKNSCARARCAEARGCALRAGSYRRIIGGRFDDVGEPCGKAEAASPMLEFADQLLMGIGIVFADFVATIFGNEDLFSLGRNN